MNRARLIPLIALIGLTLTGCSSDATPSNDQLKKDFAGGPMPPDVQKKFQESMKKSQELSQERAKNGGKP